MGLKAVYGSDTTAPTIPVRESATVTADSDFDSVPGDGAAVFVARYDSTANTGAGGWYIDARINGVWKSVELT